MHILAEGPTSTDMRYQVQINHPYSLGWTPTARNTIQLELSTIHVKPAHQWCWFIPHTPDIELGLNVMKTGINLTRIQVYNKNTKEVIAQGDFKVTIDLTP